MRADRRDVVRRCLVVVVVVAAGLAAGVCGGGPAAAATTDGPPPGAAVVTPTLGIFQFGAGSGLPLLCSVGGGVVTSAADQSPAGSRGIAPLMTQANDGCTVMSTSGSDFFGQAIEQSRGLAPLNAVLNPALATAADTLVRAGTGDAGTLAPFGPTVAGTAGLLVFLQGR